MLDRVSSHLKVDLESLLATHTYKFVQVVSDQKYILIFVLSAVV